MDRYFEVREALVSSRGIKVQHERDLSTDVYQACDCGREIAFPAGLDRARCPACRRTLLRESFFSWGGSGTIARNAGREDGLAFVADVHLLGERMAKRLGWSAWIVFVRRHAPGGARWSYGRLASFFAERDGFSPALSRRERVYEVYQEARAFAEADLSERGYLPGKCSDAETPVGKEKD